MGLFRAYFLPVRGHYLCAWQNIVRRKAGNYSSPRYPNPN